MPLKLSQGPHLFTPDPTLKTTDLSYCFFTVLLCYFAHPTVLSPTQRCCSLVRSGHPHGFHCSHRVRADWSDLPHPAGDDSSDPGQRRGSVPAALHLRFHHQDQEAALPPRAGLGTPRVRKVEYFITHDITSHLIGYINSNFRLTKHF